MGEQFHLNEATGNFTVTYDTPEENPHYREDGQAIELAPDHRVLVVEHLAFSVARFDDLAPEYIRRLHGMAAAKLAPGTVYEIRGKVPTSYGRTRGLAWYTCHAMQEWPLEEALPYPGKMNELGGYQYLGRFRA